MSKFKGLRQASHFGPTLIVSAIAFFFGNYYWWEGPAYVIAFTVATGQLVVGWSNDLYAATPPDHLAPLPKAPRSMCCKALR